MNQPRRNDNQHFGRRRSRSRDRPGSSCYYHQRFGEKARKCGSPCSYQQSTPSPSENEEARCDAMTKYSTSGRELLAAYFAVRHFRYMLEGAVFTIYTDHKPLAHAFHAKPVRHSPREARHLLKPSSRRTYDT